MRSVTYHCCYPFFQINLDSSIITDIRFRSKFDFDSTLFNEAYRHVRLYLEFGAVKRFVETIHKTNSRSSSTAILSPMKLCINSPKLKRWENPLWTATQSWHCESDDIVTSSVWRHHEQSSMQCFFTISSRGQHSDRTEDNNSRYYTILCVYLWRYNVFNADYDAINMHWIIAVIFLKWTIFACFLFYFPFTNNHIKKYDCILVKSFLPVRKSECL